MLVTDVGAGRIRRFTLDGRPLPPLGAPGDAPGQFGGLAGLAEDAQDRLYVADFTYRVVQRFNAQGQVDALWAPPPETGDGD